ncbi:MAG: hypothetical protein GY847_32015 [Proteobacteria bacterium]|nr:hypothetical protein [Pseudomonadota bacterium]
MGMASGQTDAFALAVRAKKIRDQNTDQLGVDPAPRRLGAGFSIVYRINNPPGLARRPTFEYSPRPPNPAGAGGGGRCSNTHPSSQDLAMAGLGSAAGSMFESLSVVPIREPGLGGGRG